MHSHFKSTMKNRESRCVDDADGVKGFIVALMLNTCNITCIIVRVGSVEVSVRANVEVDFG